MKNLVLAVLCAMFFGISQASAAEQKTTAETKPEQALKPEDARQLREAASAIIELLGEKKNGVIKQRGKENNQKDEETPAKPQINMAEVADKALSLLSGYVGEAAQAMQKVAPEVWRVMIRQQYANAIAKPFFPGVLLFALGILVYWIKRWWVIETINEKATHEEKKEHESESVARLWITRIIPFALFLILFIWTGSRLSDSVQVLINPEYYAFRDLVRMLLSKGML